MSPWMARRLTRFLGVITPPDLTNCHVRRAGMTVPVRVATGGLRLDEMDGTVVDRSQSGLCLDLPGPVQAGQVFRLRSLLYDDMTPWVDIEARSVRAHGGRWLVGCRFASAASRRKGLHGFGHPRESIRIFCGCQSEAPRPARGPHPQAFPGGGMGSPRGQVSGRATDSQGEPHRA